MAPSLIFSDEFLDALDDWLFHSGDKGRKAARLVKAAQSIPSAFRQCSALCYRRIDLGGSNITILGTELGLSETISSWSTDLQISKDLNPIPHNRRTSVIFRKVPGIGETVVNIAALAEDAGFIAAAKSFRHNSRGGLEYATSEKEVVLNVQRLPLRDVESWGGRYNATNPHWLARDSSRSVVVRWLDKIDGLIARGAKPEGIIQAGWSCDDEIILELVPTGGRLAILVQPDGHLKQLVCRQKLRSRLLLSQHVEPLSIMKIEAELKRLGISFSVA